MCMSVYVSVFVFLCVCVCVCVCGTRRSPENMSIPPNSEFPSRAVTLLLNFLPHPQSASPSSHHFFSKESKLSRLERHCLPPRGMV